MTPKFYIKQMVLAGAVALFAITVKAQNAATFKIKFLPNTVYTATLTEEFVIYGKYGDKMCVSSTSVDTVQTGRAGASNKYPVTIKFTYKNARFNGEPTYNKPGYLNNRLIIGTVSQIGLISIETIPGAIDVEKASRDVFKELSSYQGNIQFPDNEIKVGESFVRTHKQQIPSDTSTLAIITTYKLVSIKGG
ncbi:hypothetical protein [Mucilaginibacter antarcticus]